jgi:hypothetical protein
MTPAILNTIDTAIPTKIDCAPAWAAPSLSFSPILLATTAVGSHTYSKSKRINN